MPSTASVLTFDRARSDQRRQRLRQKLVQHRARFVAEVRQRVVVHPDPAQQPQIGTRSCTAGPAVARCQPPPASRTATATPGSPDRSPDARSTTPSSAPGRTTPTGPAPRRSPRPGEPDDPTTEDRQGCSVGTPSASTAVSRRNPAGLPFAIAPSLIFPPDQQISHCQKRQQFFTNSPWRSYYALRHERHGVARFQQRLQRLVHHLDMFAAIVTLLKGTPAQAGIECGGRCGEEVEPA